VSGRARVAALGAEGRVLLTHAVERFRLSAVVT